MKTIDKILCKVNTQYGAPMGRSNVEPQQYIIIPTIGKNGYIKQGDKIQALFDCKVILFDGAYDKGGAYWGSPSNLRVKYTKDLSYINFYRTK